MLRRGGKLVTIPLAPRTARAIDSARGPHSAGRIVRRVARRAGLDKKIGPRTLPHAFIIAAPDAGVQEAASYADPRTTMRYDGGRISLDRHATYTVAAYLAGAR